MKNILRQGLILTIIILTSCSQSENTNKANVDKTEHQVILETQNKVENALKFINGYTENASKMSQAEGIGKWLNSHNLATESFKTEVKRIIEDAFQQDPELGFGADPIFDAQDYPDNGFELDSFDENTNYLTVRGKNWPDFKLTMKIVEENEKWLVDGCGIVNIPDDKRAER